MRRIFASAIFLFTLALFGSAADRAVAASPQLTAALAELRTKGHAAASSVLATLDATDAEALRTWLAGHGRDALHAAGATDAEIGPPVSPIDYHIAWLGRAPTPPPPTPTPAPKRKGGLFGGLLAAAVPPLKLVLGGSSSSSSSTTTTPTETGYHSETTTSSSSTQVSVGLNPVGLLGMLADAASSRPAPSTNSHPNQAELLHWHKIVLGRFSGSSPESGGISVKRGLAAVRNNYADGAACIAFVNEGAKTVTRVDFDLTFIDSSGYLQTMALDRSGHFVRGVLVDGPEHESLITREEQNCAFLGSPSPGAAPISSLARAEGLIYAVRRVVYADGTSWTPAGR